MQHRHLCFAVVRDLSLCNPVKDSAKSKEMGVEMEREDMRSQLRKNLE